MFFDVSLQKLTENRPLTNLIFLNMKTKIFSALLALMAIPMFAQSGWIGINTPTPQATLDVNGTMKLRATPVAPALPGYQILAVNKNAGGDLEVAEVDPQLIANLSVTQVSNSVGTTLYSAKKTTGVNLLGLTFLTNWRQIQFLPAERTAGNAVLLNSTDNSYVVPSNGTYAVGFYFRYGTGVQATLLSGGTPGVGILKTTGATTTVLDTREFNGVSLAGLASITLSESHINSLYPLLAGDKLYFGIVNSGLLSAGLLSSSTASFFVYKVSN